MSAAAPTTSGLIFTIGTVQLIGTEIPHRFDALGGTQAVAVHHFPGGTKTVQSLGAFPSALSWDGVLQGAAAFVRAQALDRLRVSGNKQTVRYGPWAWIGIITKFEARPEHQWWVPYSIAVEPIRDTSGQASLPATAATAESVLAGVLADTDRRAADSNSPLLGLPGPTSGPAVNPSNPTLLGSVGQTTQDIRNALNGTGGLIANLAPVTVTGLQNEIAATQAALITVPGPTLASAEASALNDRFAQMAQVLTGPSVVLVYLRVVNPNLMRLASAYYGDPSQWTRIAAASGLPLDPLPAGAVALTVPR